MPVKSCRRKQSSQAEGFSLGAFTSAAALKTQIHRKPDFLHSSAQGDNTLSTWDCKAILKILQNVLRLPLLVYCHLLPACVPSSSSEARWAVLVLATWRHLAVDKSYYSKPRGKSAAEAGTETRPPKFQAGVQAWDTQPRRLWGASWARARRQGSSAAPLPALNPCSALCAMRKQTAWGHANLTHLH